MFKVLVAIFMATHSVWSSVYEVFDISKLVVEGPVCSIGEKDLFSFLTQQVDCKKIQNLETLCQEERACRIIAFPKVENTYLDKVTKDPAETCTVYFENLLKVDLAVYWNSADLVKSFYALIKELLQIKYVSPFEISIDSFAFQPSTQSFVFIDVGKLKIDDEFLSSTTQVSFDEEKKFKIAMVSFFSDSLKAQNAIIQRSYAIELENYKYIIRDFPDSLKLQQETREKKISAALPNLSPNYYNNFTISYSIDSTSNSIPSELKLKFGDFEKKITFYDPKEMFMLYICQLEGKEDDCFAISKSDFIKKEIQRRYDGRLRFEVKIQEGFYFLEEAKDQVSKRIFEVFVYFVKKEKAALIPTEILIFKNNQKDALKDDDIILCETSATYLSIKQFNESNKKTEWVFLFTNSINLEKDQNMYQIAPSYLTPDFEHCFKPDTKVFLIRGRGKQVYFISNKDESKKDLLTLESVHIRPADGESELLVVENCPPINMPYEFLLNDRVNFLKYNYDRGFYPSKIIFKNTDQSDVKITPGCRYYNNKDLMFYLNLHNDLKSYFIFNFNLQPETSPDLERKSIFYLNKDPKKKNPEFSFRVFAWPKTDSYTIFFSFYKSQDGKSNIMQAVYFNKDRDLVNIPFDTPMKESDNFPNILYYSKTSKSLIFFYSNTTFGDMQTVYLSDTEVVYQFNVLNLDQCTHLLEFNNKDRSLKLNCKFSSKNDIIIRNNSTLQGFTGLTKVLNQASNGTFGKQGKLI